MSRIAVLSDVNGNLEALDAVLRDVDEQSVDHLVFLGDSIGYGPDSLECLVRLRERVDFYLLGRLEFEVTSQHPQDELVDDPVFASCQPELMSEHLTWLRGRKTSLEIDKFHFVHCNPRGREYGCILFEHVEFGINDLEKIHPLYENVLIIGDNHQPWIFTESRGAQTGKDCNWHTPLGHDKSIISVGSVGQPRDGDPRACYVIVNGAMIEWRRVEYDLQTTISKIEGMTRKTPHLADRLLRGV